MFVFCYFCLSVAAVMASNLFTGLEELDQDLVEAIVPGGNVGVGQIPYVAAVFNGLRKFQTCAGIIITDRIVLAAGYCVSLGGDIVEPFYVSVLAGVVDMRDHDYDQWRYAEVIVSSSDTYKNVKALVLIKVKRFYINYTLKSIAYDRQKHSGNSYCMGVTWTFHDRLGRIALKSLVLKQYPLYVLNQTECLAVYQDQPMLRELLGIEYICINSVGSPRIGVPAQECMGVDGSLVFCERDGIRRPTGIATTLVGGSTCNRAASLYTFYDIGAYHKWLTEEISLLTNDD